MRYVIALVGLLVVVGVLVGLKAAQISSLISAAQAFEASGPPPEAVGTAPARDEEWEQTFAAVGNATARQGVALTSEVGGTVAAIRFESGQSVRKGQVLVELESSVERAQLASIRARGAFARTSLERSRALAAGGVIASVQLDADESNFESLDADARALAAQIARKVIRAPFDGKVGIRQVNVGQYLVPGTAVAELQSADSLFVDFTLPQQHLPALRLDMPVRATFAEGKTIEGRVSAIDSAIDGTSRTIKVRAALPNSVASLLPGAFVTVAVVLPERARVVAVPVTAVVHASYGDSVFIVEPRAEGARTTPEGRPVLVARQHFVRLGEKRGDFVAVLEGVKAKQEVVTDGAFKLRNGAPIVVDNRVQPRPELAPRPAGR